MVCQLGKWNSRIDPTRSVGLVRSIHTGPSRYPGLISNCLSLPPRRTDGRLHPGAGVTGSIGRYGREALYGLQIRRDQRAEMILGDAQLTEPARQALEVLPPVQVGIHQGLLGVHGWPAH